MPKRVNFSSIEDFDWDKSSTEKNWKKHKVHYKECAEIFFNKPLKILYDDKHSQEEDKFIALGTTNEGRRLTIIFTSRNNKIRVTSARDQSKKERRYREKT